LVTAIAMTAALHVGRYLKMVRALADKSRKQRTNGGFWQKTRVFQPKRARIVAFREARRGG